jgi:hypothetical protein
MYLVRKIITRHKYTSTVAALLFLIILGFAYVCFDLLISTTKAKHESEAYASRLSMQVARNDELTRLFAFTYFLDAWRKNRNTQFVLSFMSKGSKEQKAAMFLSDSKPVVEKEMDFRRDFSNEQKWFVEFIIAENLLKNGNRTGAYEAFERSYKAVQQLDKDKIGYDGLLIGQVAARWEEFSTGDTTIKNQEMSQVEN